MQYFITKDRASKNHDGDCLFWACVTGDMPELNEDGIFDSHTADFVKLPFDPVIPFIRSGQCIEVELVEKKRE